jgi:hypothetical protein
MTVKLRADALARVEVRVQRRGCKANTCKWRTVKKKFIIVKANKTRSVKMGKFKTGTYRLRGFINALEQQTSGTIPVDQVPVVG